MISQDFRFQRVLVTESIAGLRLREHVPAEDEKTSEGVPSTVPARETSTKKPVIA